MPEIPGLYRIAILIPAIIIGLTFHEFAHGWVADQLGDRTARYHGRLTLNPLAHVDIIGLIMLFIVGFGWAKPVPVNPYNLRGDTKRSLLLVSLAGPATNMILAVLGAIALGLLVGQVPYYGVDMLNQIVLINVVLAIFNLLPIPPLDGAKILAGLLPGQQDWLTGLETYSTIILLVLLFTGIIGKILGLIIYPIYNVLINLAGI